MAKVIQEGSSGTNPNGEDWLVEITYNGSETLAITAEPDKGGDADQVVIGSGEKSETLNIGRGNSNQIYPIIVEAESASGNCMAELEDDSTINICK